MESYLIIYIFLSLIYCSGVNTISTEHCAFIVFPGGRTETVYLFPNQNISNPDWRLIRSSDITQSELYIGHLLTPAIPCVLEICGRWSDNNSCKRFYGDSSQPKSFGGEPGTGYGIVESAYCACKPNISENCDFVQCSTLSNSHRWKGTDCAILYQEHDCQSCYFDPVVLTSGGTFSSQHSYDIKTTLVRPHCNLILNNHDEAYLHSLPAGYHSVKTIGNSPANFTCTCAYQKPTSKSLVYAISAVAVCSLLLILFFGLYACRRNRQKNVSYLDDNYPLLNDSDGTRRMDPNMNYIREELNEVQRKIALLTMSVLPDDETTDTSLKINASVEYFLMNTCDKRYVISRNRFRFFKDSVLGEGAFGKVYNGFLDTDNVTEIKVAIKQMKWNDEPNDSFLREAKTFCKLENRCENIVAFYGACFDQGLLYLLIEFCGGGSLESFLETKLRPIYMPEDKYLEQIVSDPTYQNYVVTTILPSDIPLTLTREHLKQLVDWCVQIANGMAFLTEEGILQLDLAVRNVLLTQSQTIKICDFGLSRKFGNKEYIAKALMMGGFPINSLAPEWNAVIETGMSTRLTRFVDVWSFGCTLWQMFSLNDSLYVNRGEHVSPEQMFLTAHTFLKEGRRLSRPKFATDFIWNIILHCWEEIPEDRPEFWQLREDFTTYVEALPNL